MACIYKISNKVNGKIYIGQTRSWEKRLRHYKSAPFHKTSREYSRPISNAIRKYGIDSFVFEVVEEYPNNISQDFLDEREKEAIKFYKSLTSQGGYNVSMGGQGQKRVPLTYEEILDKSRLFKREEIEEIQKMLIEQEPFYRIYQRFPTLKQTFLSNINTGKNFRNPMYDYPLHKNPTCKFNLKEIEALQTEIIKGHSYEEISSKWQTSPYFLRGLNNGTRFFSPKYAYPLFQGTKSSRTGTKTVRDSLLIKYYLIETDKSLEEIGLLVGYKNLSKIERIDKGYIYKESSLTYPLRENRKNNKDKIIVNDVSTISG